MMWFSMITMYDNWFKNLIFFLFKILKFSIFVSSCFIIVDCFWFEFNISFEIICITCCHCFMRSFVIDDMFYHYLKIWSILFMFIYLFVYLHVRVFWTLVFNVTIIQIKLLQCFWFRRSWIKKKFWIFIVYCHITFKTNAKIKNRFMNFEIEISMFDDCIQNLQ